MLDESVVPSSVSDADDCETVSNAEGVIDEGTGCGPATEFQVPEYSDAPIDREIALSTARVATGADVPVRRRWHRRHCSSGAQKATLAPSQSPRPPEWLSSLQAFEQRAGIAASREVPDALPAAAMAIFQLVTGKPEDAVFQELEMNLRNEGFTEDQIGKATRMVKESHAATRGGQ